MEENHTKIATKNIFYTILLKTYQIVAPFLLQTVFIYQLGIQYVGLNSLFSSVIGILNITELGFGSAAVFALYRPIAEKDISVVCALMNFYKKCYRIIGIIIIIISCILFPFLPKLIKADLPADINLYILYFIQIAGTVTSYLLFAYKSCLLVACQRNDLISKIGIIISTIKYLLQLYILVVYRNYYLYCIIIPVSNVLSNIVTAAIVKRIYPEYRGAGKLQKSQVKFIWNKIKALFIIKIGGVILDSVDNIVISAFLGLSLLGIYNNYFYIFMAIRTITGLLTSSIVSTIGNNIVTKDKKDNYKNFISLSFWNHWIVGWCSISMICLYQDFIKLWIGKENMLEMGVVFLLGLYFYCIQSHQVVGAYKDAAGIWDKDKLRPLCVALTNLVINLLLVKKIGIYGIVLSTIISIVFVNTFWLINNVHKLVFQTNIDKYVKMWLVNVGLTIVVGLFCYSICSVLLVNNLFEFMAKVVVCILIPNILYFIFYYKTKVFKENVYLLKNIFKNILSKKNN